MCWRLQPYVLEAATIVHATRLPSYHPPQVLLRADPVPSTPMPGMLLGALP